MKMNNGFSFFSTLLPVSKWNLITTMLSLDVQLSIFELIEKVA